MSDDNVIPILVRNGNLANLPKDNTAEHLVLAIDNSASMQGRPMRRVKHIVECMLLRLSLRETPLYVTLMTLTNKVNELVAVSNDLVYVHKLVKTLEESQDFFNSFSPVTDRQQRYVRTMRGRFGSRQATLFITDWVGVEGTISRRDETDRQTVDRLYEVVMKQLTH